MVRGATRTCNRASARQCPCVRSAGLSPHFPFVPLSSTMEAQMPLSQQLRRRRLAAAPRPDPVAADSRRAGGRGGRTGSSRERERCEARVVPIRHDLASPLNPCRAAPRRVAQEELEHSTCARASPPLRSRVLTRHHPFFSRRLRPSTASEVKGLSESLSSSRRPVLRAHRRAPGGGRLRH